MKRGDAPLRIIALGTGPFAVPTLRALVAAGHDVPLVVCRPARGRGNEPPAPMAEAAAELGLPLWRPDSVNAPEAQERLRALAADLMVVCDYGELLRRETLGVTPLGGVNLHGSLLPRHRGAAPVQHAVLCGDTETGVSVIHMTPRLDGGPVLGQARLAIDPDETAGELEARLAPLGAPLVVEVVDRLGRGDAEPLAQDPTRVSKAPRLAKEQGLIDWSLAARRVKDHVRGMHPWPRAFTFWRRAAGAPVRLTIDRVALADGPEGGAPGLVVRADAGAGGGLVVACGGGCVEVLALQPAGKRVMGAADFLRGAPLRAGELLGASTPA